MTLMRDAVAGILVHQGKVLIGKKVIKEGHFCSGGWHIPGGHVLDNEKAINAIIREFKEETNLDISVQKLITTRYVKATDTNIHWFLIETEALTFSAGSDLTEVKMVEINEVIKECDKRAVDLWPKEVLDFLSTK